MKNKLKLIICVVVIIVQLIAVTPVSFAAPSGEFVEVTHDSMGNLGIMLNRNRYDEEKVMVLKIDAKVDFDYDDWQVVSDLNSLFPNLEHLIVTGGGVKEVPGYAFDQVSAEHLKHNFKKLRSIQMTDVQTIGLTAFHECHNLEYIDFPNVLTVGSFAFEGCSSLEYVGMPKVQKLDDYAFSGDMYLKDVYLPDLEIVGGHAFDGCESLRNVYIPSVKYIGISGFYSCKSLKEICMIHVEDISKNAFEGCTGLETVVMTELKQLDSQSFTSCKNLKNYVFGEYSPYLPATYPTTGTYTSPTYHIFGDEQEYEDFRLDPYHYPAIEVYDDDTSPEEIFSFFSDHYFDKEISYIEYLDIELDHEYKNGQNHRQQHLPFVYEPLVITEFFKHMFMYFRMNIL